MESAAIGFLIIGFLLIMSGLAGVAIGLLIGYLIGRSERPAQAALPPDQQHAPAIAPPAAAAIVAAAPPPLTPGPQPAGRRAQVWSVALAFAVMAFCCLCSLMVAALAALGTR